MVKVSVTRKQHMISEVEIKQHAGFAPSGQDLVCAGVSSISVGMMNALDELVPNTCDFQMESAYVKICVKQSDTAVQLLLEAMMKQLLTLEETYKQYININEQEV